MPVMVQLRNVPDELHRKLKARAAMAGMSLSEYAIKELDKVVERPTRAELLERLTNRKPIVLRESTVEAVRSFRDRR
jgi:plasmid stability protein